MERQPGGAGYSGRRVPQSGERQQQPGDSEALPTYEETLETASHKRYTLRHPQLASPTVHAVDADSGAVAYSRHVRGLVPPQTEFYVGDRRGAPPAWRCAREREGLELVFSRQIEPPPPPPLSASAAAQLGRQLDGSQLADSTHAGPGADSDGIATDSAANLYDSKPATDDREYILQENDDAPPAYEESDQGAEQQVRLTSTEPLPFALDFSLPEDRAGSGGGGGGDEGGSGGGADDSRGRFRWLRNHEAKNADVISPERPWTAFMCVERANGRLLAEVVHYSEVERDLGTLVVHGDLGSDQHDFMIVSAIAVVEEYPLRCLAHADLREPAS
ncbi:hypothetical protein LPJ61_006570 [Coemansia biformis]|uniref:Uncharacterized protein n=1 Tax=Coemansia biformis TaxID=1286918 RepID=A0A9W8CNJ7_9FUNG|nr:hypothetical protein LPJ61_006570 [Coemansia biformis]